MMFEISTYKHKQLFLDRKPWEVISNLKKYFQELILGIHSGEISSQATITNPELVTIEEGAYISPNALIEGPCYIGRGSKVGHGAYVRAFTLLGENCLVGHASEVKHSIFLDGAKAPHFNYVGDSILGRDVNLGAGVICANLRVDKQQVNVYFEGQWQETGLNKLGAILGDGVHIGCNSVVNPGAILPPNFIAPPCSSLKGDRSVATESLQKTV